MEREGQQKKDLREKREQIKRKQSKCCDINIKKQFGDKKRWSDIKRN